MKRNRKRFPENFCFQLTDEEFADLRSQIATSNSDDGAGGRRYLPFAYDSFLILDNATCYQIGASLKDAGKKSFALSLIADPKMVTDLLNRL